MQRSISKDGIHDQINSIEFNQQMQAVCLQQRYWLINDYYSWTMQIVSNMKDEIIILLVELGLIESFTL